MGALGEPSLLGFVLAAALWVLLGVVPGLLIVTWLVPGRSRLERLAVAPLVSIALGFAPAAWLSALGVPQAWHAAWVVPLVVSVVLLVVLGRRGALRALVAGSRDARAVCVGVALTVVVWVVGIATSAPGWSAVVPNSDGNSHGVFVARILASGSVAPDHVAVFDLADPARSSVFYPLGLHALAAPVASLTSVASALLVALTVLASASFVVGCAALARRVGGAAVVAPASVAAALMPWYPVELVGWGPVPLVLGVALVPAAILVLLDARDRRSTAAAVFAVAGLLALHVTEVLVAAGVALLALLLDRRAAGRAAAAGSVVVAGAAAAVVVGPIALGLVAGGGARVQEPTTAAGAGDALVWALLRPGSALDALDSPSVLVIVVAGLVALALVGLAVAGGVSAWRSAPGRAITLAVAGFLLLGVLAQAGLPTPFSYPWYSDPDRLMAQAAGLLPVLVGAGWAVLRALPARRPGRRIVAVLGVLAAAVLAAQAVAAASDGLTRYSVVTPDDRAAYAWLAAHVRPGDRVLNDHRDGSVWAYDATRGAVAPVFGAKPSGGFETDPWFAPAMRLQAGIGRLAADPSLRDDARALDVRYVVVGSRTFSEAPRLLDVAAMSASPALREVFRAGDARVFEIVEP